MQDIDASSSELLDVLISDKIKAYIPDSELIFKKKPVEDYIPDPILAGLTFSKYSPKVQSQEWTGKEEIDSILGESRLG